jgi:gluconolactonase
MQRKILQLLLLLACGSAAGASAQTTADVPAVHPEAYVDLRTDAGVALVKGQWRYSDARFVEVAHHAVGADLRPSGPPNRAMDIEPRASAADFDDSRWPAITAPSLEERRGNGRFSLNWYRLKFTMPETVGGFPVAGSSVVFEIVIDDYAEIWVNGKNPIVLGQTGGGLVKGFNAPNRVLLARHARPGEEYTVAVLGANGPLGEPPGNYIWVRSAVLEFYRPENVSGIRKVETRVTRLDPALDEILTPGTQMEKLASGFEFTEGPVWHPDGYLLFSDPNANRIYRWSPEGQVSIFLTKSGYSGFNVGEYHQAGSNGLTLSPDGLLTIDQHGNRRVVRQEKPGNFVVLADNYQGKRLNSPNDLVYKSDGSLYFTDPAFGLPKVYDDPRKELPFQGIYRVGTDGSITLLASELKGPNGIAFSPDETYLYIGNWDEAKKYLMRYPVNADGTLGPGEVFFDMTSAPGEDALDGIKVDVKGNLYVSGPGGLWILNAAGKHLGTLMGPEHPHNLAFGDADGKTLYLTAQTGLYRIRLNIEGIRPPLKRKP